MKRKPAIGNLARPQGFVDDIVEQIVKSVRGSSKKSVKPKTGAKKPPQPPAKPKPNWTPISRAPGQQRPGAGRPAMTTAELDAFHKRVGYTKDRIDTPKRRVK
jgi:hypothetical protein